MASKKTANRLHSRNVKHGGMNISTADKEYDEDDFYEGEQDEKESAYQDAFNNDNISNTPSQQHSSDTAWRETNPVGEGKVEERHPLEISDTDYDWEQQDIQNLKRRS